MKKIEQYIKNLKLDKRTAIIFVAGIIGIVFIFISEIDFTTNKENESEDKNIVNDYCLQLENKMEEFIENIDGAGKTKVIITLSESSEYIYAKDGKEIRKNNENNDETIDYKHVIIENNNINSGLLIKTIEPKIRGIAISCEGGDNLKVQQQIYSAVSAVLNINTSRISITKLSSLEEKNEK